MNKEKIINIIDERIDESEDCLKENGTTYNEVINNEDTSGYGEDGENNNFSAGRISVLKELKEEILK